PRREPRRVQEAPEIVARVGEVRLRRVGDESGIDPAEDDAQARPEDVRDGASGSGRPSGGAASTAAHVPTAAARRACRSPGACGSDGARAYTRAPRTQA